MQTVLKEILEDRYFKYNVPAYIDDDPIQIPHLFSKKEDIEVASFLTASIAWGVRKTIIKNARQLMKFMDDQPYRFVMEADAADLLLLDKFVHRTFQGVDCRYFVEALRNIYLHHRGLEHVFSEGFKQQHNIYGALSHFRCVFFELPHPLRTEKHVSSVEGNSAAKRLNMMLRWLVRKDDVGVDLGIWEHIPMSALMIPLDVHVGKVARSLGLLERKQDDWKSVEELMCNLRQFDPHDPAKYDYSLFGMGLNKDY